jgi:hypothetical protein
MHHEQMRGDADTMREKVRKMTEGRIRAAEKRKERKAAAHAAYAHYKQRRRAAIEAVAESPAAIYPCVSDISVREMLTNAPKRV